LRGAQLLYVWHAVSTFCSPLSLPRLHTYLSVQPRPRAPRHTSSIMCSQLVATLAFGGGRSALHCSAVQTVWCRPTAFILQGYAAILSARLKTSTTTTYYYYCTDYLPPSSSPSVPAGASHPVMCNQSVLYSRKCWEDTTYVIRSARASRGCHL
jgi:hypothetical protein